MSLRNMRQIDLANKTGISKGALSSYISGRYVPKQNNIYLIAKALNVNEAWLMGLDVPMERIDDDQRIIQYEAESDEACKILEKAGYTVDFSTSNNDIIIIKDKHGHISCLHEYELVNRFEKIKSKSLDAINAEQLLGGIDMDAKNAIYYTNPETAKEAQEMFEDPEMRSLYHMKKNMDPDQFKIHMDYIKKLYKAEHPDYDEGC